MSKSNPQDDSNIQDKLTQLLSDDCPVLTPRLKTLFRNWFSVIEDDIAQSESADEFYQTVGELADRLSTVDLNEPSAKEELIELGNSLDELFFEFFLKKNAISVPPAILKMFRSRIRRGAASIPWEAGGSGQDSVLECANEMKLLFGRTGSLEKKNVDNARQLWQPEYINVEEGDKDVPHGEASSESIDVEELFSAFCDPEIELNEDEQVLRLSDLPGGQKGPDTDITLYQRWMVMANSVVDNWISGALDNDDALFVGKRIQRLGMGGGDVLDWNRLHDKQRENEWRTIHDDFESTYRRVCIFFGALTLSSRERETGKTLTAEERKRCYDRALHNTENLMGPATYDPS